MTNLEKLAEGDAMTKEEAFQRVAASSRSAKTRLEWFKHIEVMLRILNIKEPTNARKSN